MCASINPSSVNVAPVVESTSFRPLSWGAVLAGTFTALSLHLLITLFGAGLGVRMVNTLSDPDPAKKLTIGMGIVWSLSALLSLWAGGWVAGRFTPEASRRFGALHGFLVWSVATVATVFFVGGGAGLLLGGAAKATAKGVSAVGQQAGNLLSKADGGLLGSFMENNRDLLGGFVKELAPAGENNANPGGGNRPGGLSPRGQREVSWALFRLFTQDERTPANRDAVVKAITDNTGMSESDARQRVDEWIAAYDRAQESLRIAADTAERKAREAADTASRYITKASVCLVIAFILGAIAASFGGAQGARPVVVTTRNP
jgi:hypothetical protein